MSLLPSTSQTVKRLGITGVGADAIGHQLFIFHQINSRIINVGMYYTSPNTGGEYYLEGDVTGLLASYDYFWLNNRKMSDSNIAVKREVTYDPVNLWTKLCVTDLSCDGVTAFRSTEDDMGACLCGMQDVTSIVKEFGNIEAQLVEDGSLGNSVAAKFSFTLNDEGRDFYDKVNKTGYFYEKNAVTEAASVSSESKHSPLSGVYLTNVKAKELSKYYNGSDFINGFVEFLSGEALGSRFLIVGANGNNLNIVACGAKDFKDVRRYSIGLKTGDRLRVFRSDIYWFRLNVWHRDYLSDKVTIISGKLDLGSVEPVDKEKTVSVVGYSTIKDLMNLNLSNLKFDGGSNLYRLKEIRAIGLDKSNDRGLKLIQRQEVDPNPLASITVAEVAHDVDAGWHVLDYHPEGNLFRFDLGKWMQAIDEGSLEESTNSLFIPSDQDAANFNNTAVLPDHSLGSDSVENNVKIERKWHGGWCKINLELSEDVFTGAYNSQQTKSGTTQFKKFTGLPSEPFRMLFFVNKDRQITKQGIYQYSFDNGEWIIPNLFFDYIAITDIAEGLVGADVDGEDLTHCAGFSNGAYRKANTNAYFDDLDMALRLWSFNKFNGVRLMFDNSLFGAGGTFASFAANLMEHMIIRYSNGYTGENGAAHKFVGNINTKFLSGYCNAGMGSKVLLTLKTTHELTMLASGDMSDNTDGYTLDLSNGDKMYLMATSGANFGQICKIRFIEQTTPGTTDILSISLLAGFTNNIETDDRFVIINKDEEVRCLDLGDGFKDGAEPDVLACCSAGDYANYDGYYDIIANHKDDHTYGFSVPLKPNDYIYIGHRNRFNSIVFAFSINTTQGVNNDYADIAWYLRNSMFVVEYYGGENVGWKKATNVSVIPTSIVNMKDFDHTGLEEDDDYIKYKVIFDAVDWGFGEYMTDDYAYGRAPSTIDSYSVYLLRVKMVSYAPILVKRVILGCQNEMNLAITWNDIKCWKKNNQSIKNGKYIAETLLTDKLNLNMYGIEIKGFADSYGNILQARPINRFKGSLGDNLFAVVDINNIDERYSTDVINYDEGELNHISSIPKNINYLSFIREILYGAGFKNNQQIHSQLDTYNDFSKSYANIIGSDYDGVYPFELGWDEAFVKKELSDYNFDANGTYRKVSAILDEGVFKMYATSTDFTSVKLFTSKDLTNWTAVGNVIQNLPAGWNILSCEVVKNKDDSYYAFYLTMGNFNVGQANRYCVYLILTVDGAAVDYNNATKIIDFNTLHCGPVAAAHLKGECVTVGLRDQNIARRILFVTQYTNTNLVNYVPDPDLEYQSKLLLYENKNQIGIGVDWLHSDGNGNFEELDGALNPAFVYGNYAINSSVDTDLYYNSYIKLVTTMGVGATATWCGYGPAGIATGDILHNWVTTKNAGTLADGHFMNGFSSIKNSATYGYINSSDHTAHMISPVFEEAILMFGVKYDDNKIRVAAISNDFSTIKDHFYKSYKVECNGLDDFKTSNTTIPLIKGDVDNYGELILGFSRKFNKLRFTQNNLKMSDRVALMYWNGNKNAWENIPNIYQLREKITDGEVCPLFGCYFDVPEEWALTDADTITGGINTSQRLYWIKVTPGSQYSANYTLNISPVKLCFTNLWLTSGRSVYMMENWQYVKRVYSFDAEMNKEIKIDSMSFDRDKNVVIANLIQDNNYEYKLIGCYAFDVFGRLKESFPIWEQGSHNGNFHIHLPAKVRPNYSVRKGYENSLATDVGSSLETLKIMTMGYWLESFIESTFNGGIFSGLPVIGYNIPISKKQYVRKYSPRNTDWNLDFGNWAADFINNIWVARLWSLNSDPTVSGQTYLNYLVGSLTNNGLLQEELVNGPQLLLTPGFYAFLEKSYLDLMDLSSVNCLEVETTVVDHPLNPVVGASYLIGLYAGSDWASSISEHVNQILTYTNNTVEQVVEVGYTQPSYGMIIHVKDTDKYKWWNGSKWMDFSSTVLWPGRYHATNEYGMGIEFTLGQEGVKVPYYRPFNSMPIRFSNWNVNQVYDDKAVKVFRGMCFSQLEDNSIGYPNAFVNQSFSNNFRATCAAEMKDLSSIKDVDVVASYGNDTILEPSGPAMVFGGYEFNDIDASGAAVRDDGTTFKPFGDSVIAIHKPNGRVANWKKAFFYDSGAGTYTDVTDHMNFKKVGNAYDFTGGNKMYLCCDKRFFSILQSYQTSIPMESDIMFLNSSGSWAVLPFNREVYGGSNFIDRMNNDPWMYKTMAPFATFSSLKNTWKRATFQGVEGYWISLSSGILKWAVVNGMHLWDSMSWWLDYTVTSSKAPAVGGITDVNKRYFDTFVPISMEYDSIRKRVVGCFWDFKTDKYYSYSIQLTVTNYGWAPQGIVINDSDVYASHYRIQHIRNVSPVDNKCVLVDDKQDSSTAYMGNIKNFDNGQKLFNVELQ